MTRWRRPRPRKRRKIRGKFAFLNKNNNQYDFAVKKNVKNKPQLKNKAINSYMDASLIYILFLHL
jgi:hypothetical protein